MSKCSQCNTAISFMSVLNTVNPLKVKCTNCKEPVHFDKTTGLIAVFVILAIIIPILIYHPKHFRPISYQYKHYNWPIFCTKLPF